MTLDGLVMVAPSIRVCERLGSVVRQRLFKL